jgi:hypothetical protein
LECISNGIRNVTCGLLHLYTSMRYQVFTEMLMAQSTGIWCLVHWYVSNLCTPLCTYLYGIISQMIRIFVCTFLFAKMYSISSKYQHQILCLGTCITTLMKIFTYWRQCKTSGNADIFCVFVLSLTIY